MATELESILASASMQAFNAAPTEQIFRQLEAGLTQLSRDQYFIGMHLDVTRLTVSAMVKLFISKGILTEEEWATQYEKEVLEVMRKHQEEMNKLAHQEQAIIPNIEKPEEPEDSIEINSDVVLPSEKNEVIKFG